ncbi:hypothetical protein Golomagni_02373 [Golovinomyces magnicellulatus]|nr:hypothetical protein Golomagni_02373 [Golovinomyces magnicellulatus]
MEIMKRSLLFLGSILILCRGTGLDALMLFYLISNKYIYDLPSVDDYILRNTVRYVSFTTISLIILLVLRCIEGLKQKSTISDDLPLKPYFFPCKTSHSRMFPVRHSFSYSYLLTGIPIGFKGSVGGLISIDEVSDNAWFSSRAWFTIHGDDYLARGHHPEGLQGKLKDYLRSQGVDHEQFSQAYLFTAAKFLGYASNPVSIWYLYTPSNELKALILEVNNTFDERHSYFLEPSSNSLPKVSSATTSSTRYTSKWPKDFYVSTFNDRSGCYSLSLTDPFAPVLTGTGHINTNITLSGPSNSRAMIVTLLRSTSRPLNPERMSLLEKLRFLFSWWWVGFATFPRTLQQAFILFFRKKMAWAFRPEPRRKTISRPADDTEKLIEEQFRAFLKARVEQFQEPLIVRYQSAGLIGEENAATLFISGSILDRSLPEVEIVVLTPVFYSNLALYASLGEAFMSESTESQTLFLSDNSIVPKLNLETSSCPNFSKFLFGRGFPARYLLTLLAYLRKSPRSISVGDVSDSKTSQLLVPKLSELDIYVLQHASLANFKNYAWKLIRLMMIDHIAFRSTTLWKLEVLTVRTIVAWLILRGIFG